MVFFQAPAPTQVTLIWEQALGLQVILTRFATLFPFYLFSKTWRAE